MRGILNHFTFNHVSGESFKNAAKIDMVHMPYKGMAPALIDLGSGQVQMVGYERVPMLRKLTPAKTSQLTARWDRGTLEVMRPDGFRDL